MVRPGQEAGRPCPGLPVPVSRPGSVGFGGLSGRLEPASGARHGNHTTTVSPAARSQQTHRAAVPADGSIVGRSDLVSAGDQFVFTVDNISAGSYNFLCDQPGHADAGMKGTLTIS